VKLSDENRDKLAAFRKETKAKKRRRARKREYQPVRALSEAELLLSDGNPARRRRLERQGVRAHPQSPLFPPGTTLSVVLGRCQHRTRVDVLAAGRIPARASCPRCQRWSDTLPGSARIPRPNASRALVSERVEERDGRIYTVKTLATPRRARAR
jgi:hypothetical protein